MSAGRDGASGSLHSIAGPELGSRRCREGRDHRFTRRLLSSLWRGPVLRNRQQRTRCPTRLLQSFLGLGRQRGESSEPGSLLRRRQIIRKTLKTVVQRAARRWRCHASTASSPPAGGGAFWRPTTPPQPPQKAGCCGRPAPPLLSRHHSLLRSGSRRNCARSPHPPSCTLPSTTRR